MLDKLPPGQKVKMIAQHAKVTHNG